MLIFTSCYSILRFFIYCDNIYYCSFSFFIFYFYCQANLQIVVLLSLFLASCVIPPYSISRGLYSVFVSIFLLPPLLSFYWISRPFCSVVDPRVISQEERDRNVQFSYYPSRKIRQGGQKSSRRIKQQSFWRTALLLSKGRALFFVKSEKNNDA